MVLVELLTGRPPYEAKSPHEYFILHASQAPMKSIELPVDLPGSAALQTVIEKALARDRNQRYSSAREFALALEEIEKTLPNPRDMATMAMPFDGDETMKLGRKTVDTLHRSTVITNASQTPAQAPPPPPAAPVAAPTLLTPLPQQQFVSQPPKQGSILPLIVVGVVVLLFAATAVGVYVLWPFGKSKTDTPVTDTATTTTQPTTTAPAKVAEASVTVTSGTGEPITTTTAPPPVIVEQTQTVTPPVTTTTAPPKPKVEVVEKPKETPPAAEKTDDETPTSEDEADPNEMMGAPTYVDGGGDDDANERALTSLRRGLRGTNAVALRAGGMTAELTRALREEFPGIQFAAHADVVIRFDGRYERRARALKRRAAFATVSKNGRVIFRYQLPDEVYRVGHSPAEAFARVLASALEE
jgi:hypothetical protein